MTDQKKRTRIHPVHSDLSLWPQVDISRMDREDQRIYNNKQTAITLYAAGSKFDVIETETGIRRNEVYRALRRCLTLAPDGHIYGFRALVIGTRVKEFERTADVVHEKGSGSGGCAGALSQLFKKFPEVESLVIDLFCKLGSRDAMHEARIAIVDIHNQFKKKLRELGFTDDDWPFSTGNVGYKAIYTYCKSLRLKNAQGTMGARAGEEAVLRSQAGNGSKQIFPMLRPYGAVQLDFHKVDSATVIVLENDYGEEFEVPLSRWYFGLVVEEHSRSALGYAVVLELTR